MLPLLENAGNGNGPTVFRPQPAVPGGQQFFTLFVWGDFDGATVTIEVSPGGSAPWFDSGVVITAAQAINIEFKARKIRGVVTGGGGTVSISADMV